LQMLLTAALHLGLPLSANANSIERFYAEATRAWAVRHGMANTEDATQQT